MNAPQHSPQPATPAPRSEAPARAPQTAAIPDVFAMRKGCSADGMGLSHYILMKNTAP